MGRQEETYQAIFWPLMMGILTSWSAMARFAPAGGESGDPAWRRTYSASDGEPRWGL